MKSTEKLDIIAALSRGHDTLDAEHRAEEAGKLGQLRGGTTGIVTPDGEVYGKCPRVAYLRSTGLDLPLENPATRDMFIAGYFNEEAVIKLLGRGLGDGLSVVAGAEIARSYTLDDGTVVSMRPDALVLDGGKPACGLEFKMVASLWTAIAVAFDLRAKSDHLIQAALYSAAYDFLPFTLLYSSRTEFHLSTAPKWLQSKFQPGHPKVAYKKEDASQPLKITPFNVAYELSWRPDGKFQYWTDGMDEPCATVIDKDSLLRYHKLVCEIRDTGTLGPRPGGGSVDGSKSYKPCDYCPLSSVCDSYEDNKPVWLDQVRLTIGRDPAK